MQSNNHLPQGNVTIMFTDIENSSIMTNELGNLCYESILQPHNKVLDEVIKKCDGSVVKKIGDSFMAVFENADSAIKCSFMIQTELEGLCIEAKDDNGRTWQLKVRIGVHKAEKELFPDDEGDYLGTDVNFASRIESIANGAQVLISENTKKASNCFNNYKWHEWTNRRIKSFDKAETVFELYH